MTPLPIPEASEDLVGTTAGFAAEFEAIACQMDSMVCAHADAHAVYPNPHPLADRLRAALSTASLQIAELQADLKTALKECSRWATEAGFAKGKLEMSEAAGIVEGWQERCEAAEAQVSTLTAERDEAREQAAQWQEWAAETGENAATDQAARLAAEARIQELEGALRPFAEMARHLMKTPPKRTVDVVGNFVEHDGIPSRGRACGLKAADFYTARSLLPEVLG